MNTRITAVWMTANPTAESIANQLTEACGWYQIPRYLIRDRRPASDRVLVGDDRANLPE